MAAYLRTFLILAALTAMVAGAVTAQVLYGTLVGRVNDPTGAAVPDAAVSLTSDQTNLARQTTTNEAGGYAFANVLPGTYRLEVSARGFQTYAQTGIPVTINTVTRIDLDLRVGQVSETLTVSGAVAALQTDKADVHAELTTKAITELPLGNYRNYQTLINLVPGAAPVTFINAITDTPARSFSININGTNRTGQNTRVDGVLNKMNIINSHTLYVPPTESIETVNVATNAFDAEQGMTGGSAITLTTRSGTNELHGAGFAYHTNNHLRARNFFFQGNLPKNIVNIDGATLGGPIRREKLFYFGSWEGSFERVNRSGLFTVATAEAKRGDFSRSNTGIYDPLTGTLEGRGRSLFPNNIVPLSRQSSITQKMQDLVPLPNLAGTASNFFNSGTQALSRNNVDVKINWNRTSTHSIWGKYGLMDAEVSCVFALGEAGGGNLCDGPGGGVGTTLVQLANIGHTWVLSPGFLIDGTIGYSRMGQDVVGPDYGEDFGLKVLGIPGTNGPDIRYSGKPIFQLAGYETFGNPNQWQPSFRKDAVYTHTTNVSWTRGAHATRFGFDVIRYHQNDWQPNVTGGPRGMFTFDGGSTALNGGPAPNQFNAYAEYLLGLPGAMRKALQYYSPQTAREWQFGWYFQDRWQATRNLTLSLGLRYEYYPVLTRANLGTERYDPKNNKVLIGRRGGNQDTVGIEVSNKLFAPRFGLAYRLGPDTVIRTGYGISIDPSTVSGSIQRPYPVVVGKEFLGVNSFQAFRPIEQGIPPVEGPDISKGIIDLPPETQTMTQGEGLFHRGYIQSWNFTVERKLPGDFVASAAYVGTRTVRDLIFRDLNAGYPGLGLAGRALYPQFRLTAAIRLLEPGYDANYHSLQLTVNRQFSRGLFVKGAYTFGKAINFADAATAGAGSLSFHTPDQARRNRAPANFDRTHILQLSAVYELPFGPGKRWASRNGALSAVVRDWQINTLFASYTGAPFSVTASGASLNAPGNTQTGDQVKPDVIKSGGIGIASPWFDPVAFQSVTEARYGTTGRNILRGPGAVNVDLGVFRDFPIRERLTLQFRAEAFNASNTPHFNNPNNNVSTRTNFATITSAQQDQRVFRFALRLSF